MASLNLAGKTSGYVKLTAPDDSSSNPTVTLPTESGELALKGDSIVTQEGTEVTVGDDDVTKTWLKGEVETEGKLRVMSDNQPLDANHYLRVGTGRAISLGTTLDGSAGLLKCSVQNELEQKGNK